VIRSRRRLALPFILPALLLYVAFCVYPAIDALWLSLHSWQGAGTPFTYIGLGNFTKLTTDPVFWLSTRNSLLIVVGVGVAIFVFGFLFTAVLRTMRSRKTLRAILFLPSVVPPVALGIIWAMILAPDFGIVNPVLRAIGLGRLSALWLSPGIIFYTIMVAMVWINTGFYTTIILSGQDRIPADYYDLAQVEGAEKFQQFWYVTLPMMWDVVSVASILWVISGIKAFDFVYAFSLQGSFVPQAVWTMGINVYMTALASRIPVYQLGYGSAIGIMMIVIVAVLVLFLRRVMRREAVEY